MFFNLKSLLFLSCGKQNVGVKTMTALNCQHRVFTGLITTNLPIIIKSFILQFLYIKDNFFLYGVTIGVFQIVQTIDKHDTNCTFTEDGRI